jgi:hypothetical protein
MGIMGEETWSRHSNPWSAFTRLITYPLVFIPVWYIQVFLQDPLGFWYPLAGVALVIAWFAINPRIFPKPKRTDNWFSVGVLGEQIWTKERRMGLTLVLEIMTAPFFIAALFTAYTQQLWPTLFCASVAFLLKVWFVDRMGFYYKEKTRNQGMEGEARFHRRAEEAGDERGGCRGAGEEILPDEGRGGGLPLLETMGLRVVACRALNS